MGSSVNTGNLEDGAYVSPDGKYLFFNRVVAGKSDIYWVDAGIIQSLKEK